MNVPLSMLGLASISEGSDAATALRNTVDLAQHAEQWATVAIGSPNTTSCCRQFVAGGADRADRRGYRPNRTWWCRPTGWSADELVITSVTHQHADGLRSHELITKRRGL